MAKKKAIEQKIEKGYEKLIKKFDKIFEEEYGKMCPDFEPLCVQCRVNLIYNKFKKDLFDELVK